MEYLSVDLSENPRVQIKVNVQSRPLRVVYLVEDGKFSHEILDAVFSECYMRWGGKWTPVLPVNKGEILEDQITALSR